MDIRHWLIFAIGASLVGAMTWLACHWWYGRKLETASQRLQKSDKARLFSIQQTLQARKQIEALQKDLAAQQQAMAQAQIAREHSRQHMEAVLKAAAAADAETEALARRPAHGFADTQPML